LSGMSTMEQVVQNVAAAAGGYPASLSAAEVAAIGKVQLAYKARTVVDCTACRYCMPCPQGIDIPAMFAFLNDASLFGNVAEERRGFEMLVRTGQSASPSACAKCEQCLEACPQQLDVPRELGGVAKTFE
jgi:predicted aldo/keto reductase-like oxidoreductase